MNSLLILIAGPYRSGTRNNPELIAANLARLEEADWRSSRPAIDPDGRRGGRAPDPPLGGPSEDGGEDGASLATGSCTRRPNVCRALRRLLGCPGSRSARTDVAIAHERGLPVWFRIEDVPGCGRAAPAMARVEQ